jgi:hypothetical protein
MENYLMLSHSNKIQKALLFQLRLESNAFVSEIAVTEEEIINLKRKYYAKEEKVKSGISPDSPEKTEVTSPLRK